MHKIKVMQVGNSLGIVLSKELLERLRINKGDTLYWHETPTGIELSPYNPELADQMGQAEEIMRRNRDALKKLSE